MIVARREGEGGDDLKQTEHDCVTSSLETRSLSFSIVRELRREYETVNERWPTFLDGMRRGVGIGGINQQLLEKVLSLRASLPVDLRTFSRLNSAKKAPNSPVTIWKRYSSSTR